uniref:GRAM domain containing 1C n=1 Tax=Crocodylus porosus TaxID=8502 RepID=A0A7M4E747_CROPO
KEKRLKTTALGESSLAFSLQALKMVFTNSSNPEVSDCWMACAKRQERGIERWSSRVFSKDWLKSSRRAGITSSWSLYVDYACALQKDIFLQGRLYLSENWLCFHSNIFRWETTISIALKDITFMTKEKTARLIPNAIQIATKGEKFFFTSFSARDRSYLSIFRLWQNALLDKRLTKQEFWQLVHQSYGSELGLNTEEMESFHSSSEDNGPSRSSVCDDSGEKDEKLPKAISPTREPVAQMIEVEPQNGNVLPGVIMYTAFPFLPFCTLLVMRNELLAGLQNLLFIIGVDHRGSMPVLPLVHCLTLGMLHLEFPQL